MQNGENVDIQISHRRIMSYHLNHADCNRNQGVESIQSNKMIPAERFGFFKIRICTNARKIDDIANYLHRMSISGTQTWYQVKCYGMVATEVQVELYGSVGGNEQSSPRAHSKSARK